MNGSVNVLYANYSHAMHGKKPSPMIIDQHFWTICTISDKYSLRAFKNNADGWLCIKKYTKNVQQSTVFLSDFKKLFFQNLLEYKVVKTHRIVGFFIVWCFCCEYMDAKIFKCEACAWMPRGTHIQKYERRW